VSVYIVVVVVVVVGVGVGVGVGGVEDPSGKLRQTSFRDGTLSEGAARRGVWMVHGVRARADDDDDDDGRWCV